MSDDKPWRPPLPARVTRDITRDPDEVFIPPAPETQRLPLPKNPLKLDVLHGRQPSFVEFSAQLGDFKVQLDGAVVAVSTVLATQRKMALQLDGFQNGLNGRFDVFHQELAMLRATVTGDHAPRLDAVEKATVGQRMKVGAILGGKYAAYLTLAAVVLRAAGKAFPEFGQAIEGFLGAFGL